MLSKFLTGHGEGKLLFFCILLCLTETVVNEAEVID